MEIWQWTAQNWFNLFSVLGILGSLWFSIITFRASTKTQRITNLLAITQNHRETWREFTRNPSLKRILNPLADLKKEPITDDEHVFVNTVVSHMNGVFYATEAGLTINYEGLQNDAAWFFSLPIPRAVWEKIKKFQNQDFIEFVESSKRSA
jgi:hypothetical protein